ncbi:MAG TPA: redoxin domain-containing protein, partial [Bryobacteraceae bacterium]
SQAVLRDFAQRKGITYPMLSDPESKVIRAFGILNPTVPPGPYFGVPYPGLFLIDERGVVKSKYFEDDYKERYTAGDILTHEFGADGVGATVLETPHLKLTWSASDSALQPGARTALILTVEPKPGMHLYAPGIEGGYIPIDWRMAESKAWTAQAAAYPPAKRLRLEAIHETVPVYDSRIRLLRDITLVQQNLLDPLLAPGRMLTVEGEFRYQACDAKVCYTPRTVPLKWTFRIGQLDRQRVPDALQRK